MPNKHDGIVSNGVDPFMVVDAIHKIYDKTNEKNALCLTLSLSRLFNDYYCYNKQKQVVKS